MDEDGPKLRWSQVSVSVGSHSAGAAGHAAAAAASRAQSRLCINIRKYFIRPQLAAGLGWYQATVNKIINIGIMSLSCVELKT